MKTNRSTEISAAKLLITPYPRWAWALVGLFVGLGVSPRSTCAAEREGLVPQPLALPAFFTEPDSWLADVPSLTGIHSAGNDLPAASPASHAAGSTTVTVRSGVASSSGIQLVSGEVPADEGNRNVVPPQPPFFIQQPVIAPSVPGPGVAGPPSTVPRITQLPAQPAADPPAANGTEPPPVIVANPPVGPAPAVNPPAANPVPDETTSPAVPAEPAAATPSPQPQPPVAAPPVTQPPATTPPVMPPVTPPPATDDNGDEKLTIDSVQAKLAALKEETLDDAQKKVLSDLYDAAITDLKAADTQSALAVDYSERLKRLPEEIEKAKATKLSLAKPELYVLDKLTLPQLRQDLTQFEQQQIDQKSILDQAVNDLKNFGIHEELAKQQKLAQERLGEADEQLKKVIVGADAPRKSMAERLRLLAKKQAAAAEIKRFQAEAAWRQARADLLPLNRDIAAATLARLDEKIRLWRNAIDAARQAELTAQTNQAQEATKDAAKFDEYPSILAIAERIETLVSRRKQSTERLPQLNQELDSSRELYETLSDNYAQSEERVTAAGHSRNIGLLLRAQLVDLPDERRIARDIQERDEELQRVQLEILEMTDRTKLLADLTKATEAIFENPLCKVPMDLRESVRPAVLKLLETERESLDGLRPEYDSYRSRLWDLQRSQAELIKLTATYRGFINEHVLWIRSTNELWNRTPEEFRDATTWAMSPHRWGWVISTWWTDILGNPVLWLLALAAIGLLAVRIPKLRSSIRAASDAMESRAVTAFRPTWITLLQTLVLSAFFPLILMFLGWRLLQHVEAKLFVNCVGQATLAIGLVLFPMEFFRHLCRRHGLAQSHFGWSPWSVGVLRRNLRWYLALGLTFGFWSALFRSASLHRSADYESAGRAAFVAAVLVTAYFLHRVLNLKRGAVREYLAYHTSGWVYRTRYFLWLGSVGAMLILAGLAIAGWHYTAGQLMSRLYWTLAIVLAVMVIDSLVQRWLMITRRRIAMEQYRQKREAAREAGGSDDVQSPVVSAGDLAKETAMDATQMNLQTRSLIRSVLGLCIVLGLWTVWVDVLPALSIFKKIEIPFLSIERTIEPEDTGLPSSSPPSPMPDANSLTGGTTPTPGDSTPKTAVVPINLADVMLAVLLLVIFIIAARNVPGLLEMLVLQRLPLDNAARYAITTLSRYALTFLAIISAFYTLGFRWQNVQWLAAALMLGLGFGLQEIFANFFSGLIVLFERPVRVGDIVTVGDVSGVVSKIRMRATTIINWDRHEMIMPNKDLITGRLLNWTLSDSVQRIFIQVGIAYGSDTKKATDTLYRVLHEHPVIMNEPAPMVTFCGFGDSTLNFEIRCFLPRADLRLPTTHDLHTQIDLAFREAGIEIAFPQRDLHIRTMPSALQTTPQTPPDLSGDKGTPGEPTNGNSNGNNGGTHSLKTVETSPASR